MKKIKWKNKKGIVVCLGFLLFFIILFLILWIFHWNKKQPPEFNVNFSSRVEKLANFDSQGIMKYGWLQVEGTNIDLPIISGVFSGEVDYSFGWLSPSSVGYKTRKVLVGHNVLNVSSNPMVNNEILTDFEDLMSFVYYNFAKEHMYLSYTENGVDKIFVIYGIGFYDYYYDNAQGLNTEEEIKNYFNLVKENSIYNYNVDVNENDNIITVKTCTRYFGANEKQQFVIDARELREGETPIKYQVKKTKLYQEYGLKDYYTKGNNAL